MAILMTEQLAKQLIEHYEKCISEVRKHTDVYKAQYVCSQYNTNAGLCFCAQSFGEDVYSCEWLKSIPKTKRWYINNPPGYCEIVPDIITALQTRVDILKTFKKENNG